jgi:hypothetical protein
MLRLIFLFVLALTYVPLGNSAFAAGPFGTIRIGLWSGGAFTKLMIIQVHFLTVRLLRGM